MARHHDERRTTPWNRDFLLRTLGDAQVIVLANREPFSHEHGPGGAVAVKHSTSGLVTALEPLVRACSGVWVAHGGGTADRLTVDAHDGVRVPIDNPTYRLRRVWLDPHEEQGYYYGFANEGLWPLCHRAHVRPVFRQGDFTAYWEVNARFVDAACDEAEDESPVLLVQDYHFALAPQMLRERLPLATIVAFWHIPWPHWDTFQICPWGEYLLNGLLGSDIVGFQTPADCSNFLATIDRGVVGAHVDHDQKTIAYGGRTVHVRVYPASIEWPNGNAVRLPSIDACRDDVRQHLQLAPDVRLGVGVDRLDYTKGLEEKFLVVERLLETYPEFRQSFTFVQVAEPSRERLPAYRDVRVRVSAIVKRINAQFGGGSHRPAMCLDAHHEPDEVYRLLRAADVCYVGSVHDGMNLVAKEFVSARDDEQGVLVLSAFTGAARELTRALIVNPYDIDAAAHTLAEALRMPQAEQRDRMRRLRAVVAQHTAYDWAHQILADAMEMRPADKLDWQPDRRDAASEHAGTHSAPAQRRRRVPVDVVAPGLRELFPAALR